MAAMSLGVFQASPSIALDGPQALDGGWALDSSGASVAFMNAATIDGPSMSGTVSSLASMTGAQ